MKWLYRYLLTNFVYNCVFRKDEKKGGPPFGGCMLMNSRGGTPPPILRAGHIFQAWKIKQDFLQIAQLPNPCDSFLLPFLCPISLPHFWASFSCPIFFFRQIFIVNFNGFFVVVKAQQKKVTSCLHLKQQNWTILFLFFSAKKDIRYSKIKSGYPNIFFQILCICCNVCQYSNTLS